MRHAPPSRSLVLDYESLRGQLLPELLGRVFHVTSQSRYEEILGCGMVRNNADGSLGNTYPQSAISLGRKRGYVCLFDLRSLSEDQLQSALDCFFFLSPYPLGDDLAFLFLRHEVHGDLTLWDHIRSEVPVGEFRIPHAECWYPSDLPLSAVQDVLLVHVRRKPIPPDSHLAALIAANDRRKALGE